MKRARAWNGAAAQDRELMLAVTSRTNIVREAYGLGLLGWSPALAAAALDHARDLLRTDRFSHDGSDGSNPVDRVHRHDPDWVLVGENLACGQQRPAEPVDGWLNSPPHRRNLLNVEFTHCGTAVLPMRPRLGYIPGFMWVQVYGSRT